MLTKVFTQNVTKILMSNHKFGIWKCWSVGTNTSIYTKWKWNYSDAAQQEGKKFILA